MKDSRLRGETVDELLKRYAIAAVSHGQAIREASSEEANFAYDTLDAILGELWRRGPEARDRLLALLFDERIEVRAWAASHALEFASEQAEEVLKEISAGPRSLLQFSATLALREWRAGRLRFPGSVPYISAQ
jgi:Domain of unknown function (DUF2019)